MTMTSSSTREQIADAILGSESFLWLMSGPNHVEAHLEVLRPAWEAWLEAGGKSWGKM